VGGKARQQGFWVTSIVIIILLLATLALVGAQKMAVDMLAAVSQSVHTGGAINN
jgi:Tfp pilus assembly protein PilX